MSALLAFFSSTGPRTPVEVDLSPLPDRIDGGERPAPYSLDFGAGPYRAPIEAVIPTYDGGDQTVHPSVVDMVRETGSPFRGFRFWMAHTPYQNSDVTLENPCISVSNDGWEWQDPQGVTNPIFGPPTTGGFYGDTDLVWDPDRQEFFVSWVWLAGNAQLGAVSKDGVHWMQTANIGGFGSSPTMVRKGPNDWWMMKGDETGVGSVPTTTMFHASTPTGPWVELGPVVIPSPGVGAIWHYQMAWDESSQMFHWIGMVRNEWSTFTAVSADGMTWHGSTSFLPGSGFMYRPSFTLDGSEYNVWGTREEWKIQYLRIPRTHWDNIPVV